MKELIEIKIRNSDGFSIRYDCKINTELIECTNMSDEEILHIHLLRKESFE